MPRPKGTVNNATARREIGINLLAALAETPDEGLRARIAAYAIALTDGKAEAGSGGGSNDPATEIGGHSRLPDKEDTR